MLCVTSRDKVLFVVDTARRMDLDAARYQIINAIPREFLVCYPSAAEDAATTGFAVDTPLIYPGGIVLDKPLPESSADDEWDAYPRAVVNIAKGNASFQVNPVLRTMYMAYSQNSMYPAVPLSVRLESVEARLKTDVAPLDASAE